MIDSPKTFATVIYCNSMMLLSFCVIKLYQLGIFHGNGSKLPKYCFVSLAPDKTIPNTAVIHCHILTLEKEVPQ
jgi:hypothetical protein